MEKKKIRLRDISYDELIQCYVDIENCIAFLDDQYENVKKLEEENS